MASPQIENGYTKIANELLEAIIRWRLSKYELDVLMVIIRKTYGWRKKQDWISLSQLSEATGIQIPHISRAINLLVKQNIVTKGGSRKKPLLSVQKDYDRWVMLPKGVRSHHPIKGVITEGGSTKGGNSTTQKGAETKETITKEIDTFASQSVKLLKLNRKPMAFRAYDESNPTDDLPSVDADSGETAPVTQKKARDSVATRVSAYFFHRASEAVGKPLINQGYGYVKKFTKTAPEKVLMAVVDDYFDRDPSDPTNIYKCLNAKNINKVLSEI